MKIKTYASLSSEISKREVENARISYDAALESIVLFENDGALPVKPGKIALYGNGAIYTIKGGTGSGEVNERNSISVLEGLENAGFTITNQSWLSDYRFEYSTKQHLFTESVKKMVKDAFFKLNLSIIQEVIGLNFNNPFGRMITDNDVKESACDTCFFVLARQTGEGMDRNPDDFSFNLAPEEIEQIRFLAKNYKKTIIIINTGACMNLSPIYEIKGINSIIYMGMLGGTGGNALADIIAGKCAPSGHLTATWMKSYDDVPYGRTYGKLANQAREADYKEGIFVGYRYYDTFNVEPRYEFGYGKSYTTFMFQCLSAVVDKTTISMRVSVTNTGNYFAGREVVQIYACGPKNIERPYQQLTAFGKSKTLAPQTSEELELCFDMKDLARYDEETNAFILDSGDYVVRIGNSSRNTIPYVSVSIASDVIISRHLPFNRERPNITEIAHPSGQKNNGHNMNRSKNFFLEADNREPIFRLKINVEEFPNYNYTVRMENIYEAENYIDDENEAVRKVLTALTINDCVDVVVGDGLDIMGKVHDFYCPGAVGYTTPRLVSKGLQDIALCDGPAGVRLLKTAGIQTGIRAGFRGKKVKAMEPMVGFFNYLPNYILKMILGNAKRDKLVYQYTTAFPAAHSLAQSWNTELVETVGRAISREMTEYGVTFLLAPGMNIHRNPLCGRNFEYYSEDPLLSGKMAAAVTRGVEETPGNFVTLKHFCCNNQETERMQMSSNLNERALREIYLRGYEIAVREAKPTGVMTSYNKLNGIYTANLYDLLTRVLRHEWGFDGVVMTDWLATVKGVANPALCLKTGNDLIMPGTKRDKKVILKALKKGLISENDLRRSAANVVRAVMQGRSGCEV
ncbi:MAG: glycoside hydrolase family 3 C-terminal domain-containing protein [Lachnospiraceae bacterium]|nr:glycoside hydrolase family 3 C-terminal domain-containing protein [Lachnospiraceae bacterium]